MVGAAAPSDLEPAFAALAQRGANALVVSPDPFLDSHRETLVSLTARYAVPAIFQWREFVQAGGLVSYGSSLTDAHRHQGVYAGKILNGAKPTDLPVVQPTKFEMFLNRVVSNNGLKWAICSVRSEGRSVGCSGRLLDAFSSRRKRPAWSLALR